MRGHRRRAGGLTLGSTGMGRMRLGLGAEPSVPEQFASGDWSVADAAIGGTINITIASLPDDGGSPITDIEYSIDEGGGAGPWTSVGAAVPGVYPVSGLENGVLVAVTIRAVNAVGNGPTSNSKAATPNYSAEALALFARITVAPDDTRKGLINTLIVSLKSAGVWTKLDAFYMLAAADAQSSLLNWVSTSYNLTAVNSPAFVADRGYTGDGATSYLDTGFNPTTAPSPKFVQDSAHMGLYSRTDLPNGAGDSHDMGSANSYIARSGAVAGRAGGRPNAASGQVLANGAYPGDATWTRSAAAVWEGYAQGADAGGGTTASAAPANANIRLLAGSSLTGLNQLASANFGSNLTAGEVLALRNARLTFLQAIGAA